MKKIGLAEIRTDKVYLHYERIAKLEKTIKSKIIANNKYSLQDKIANVKYFDKNNDLIDEKYFAYINKETVNSQIKVDLVKCFINEDVVNLLNNNFKPQHTISNFKNSLFYELDSKNISTYMPPKTDNVYFRNSFFYNSEIQIQNQYITEVHFDNAILINSKIVINRCDIKKINFAGVRLLNSTFIIKDTDLYKICIFNVESMDSGIVINNGDIEEFIVNNLKVDTLEITKSRINKKIIFNGVELNKLSLENSSFQCLLDLRNVKIKSMININEFKNFTNVYLPYMDEPNIIMDLVLHNNNSNFIKSKEFKKLKQISNQNYDYPLEDYFYIWEKRMQREQYTKFQKFIDERFWDKCIGYGMEPVKLWKFLYRVFLFFTALFLIPNTLTSLSDSISIHWYDKIYFSAITFLTIGYGDLQPIGIGKIIAPIEGFFGLLLTGGFVAILLRKLIRK